MRCINGLRQTHPGHKRPESRGGGGGGRTEEATFKCTNTVVKRKVIKNADGTNIGLDGAGTVPTWP